MSYLADKVPCKHCGELYDQDILDAGQCRDCRMDESFLSDSMQDWTDDLDD